MQYEKRFGKPIIDKDNFEKKMSDVTINSNNPADAEFNHDEINENAVPINEGGEPGNNGVDDANKEYEVVGEHAPNPSTGCLHCNNMIFQFIDH